MNLAPRRIGLLGFDGVTALHLTGPADVFTAAALDDGYGNRIPCYEVYVVGLSSAPFRAESGVIFRPEKTLRTAPAFDTIIVPGGPGILAAETKRAVSVWLKRRAPGTRRIAALCTGIYALAPTGLLDGREVTTHRSCAPDIARRFPNLKVDHTKQCVRDGSFYTAAGLMAGIDLSQKLVEEDYGPQVALSLERNVAMHFAPPHDEEESALARRYFANQSDDRFAELVAWMLRNLDEDLSVELLARRACMCPTVFTRSFKSVFGATPGAFVQNLRLHEVRRRLSTKRKALHTIAQSVGFADPKAFGVAFHRRFGVKPIAPAFAENRRQ